ncbi:hypothetical protein CWI39_0303p0010 [Hamiltosporidium magnivora]|uniref:Uncharacterized protein n=1 Tax=Hamiltosporidium magnivora TaxID=148818 RepID=A0A4Q9LJ63_9MICR|nr:hypothetical protein CWI39_0303p0010 [Hamiltosporidium magnivora]
MKCYLGFQYTNEIDAVLNLVSNYEEFDSKLINNQMKAKCPCQINRDKMNKKPEKYLTEKMFIRDKVRKYYTCIIESIDIIGLNFELFENFNDLDYLPDNKIKIEKFYTILYFLEYFRVRYDNKLRNAIKVILYSLIVSDVINTFEIKNISLHFAKQDYFSHKLSKIISQEYFKIIKSEMNSDSPCFLNATQIPEIRKIENVHIIEDIINNIKNVYQQSSLEDAIMCNKNIPERNKDLYLKLLKKDNFKDKIKIFEFLILYLDTILETNTKKIIIEDLEITSSFLKYLLSINGLENLEIKNSEIFIEKDICIKNNSIKYFRFSPKNSDNLHCFYEIINMMQGLKEINFESTESITFRQYDENFDFKTIDNDISASKCPSESLK